VKVQSLQSYISAFSLLYANAGTRNPFLAPFGKHQRRTSLGSTRLGLSHFLGEYSEPTWRGTEEVVVAAQNYCVERSGLRASQLGDVSLLDLPPKQVKAAVWWISLALYIVLNTMAFLRPNELTKCTLHGMGQHYVVGERRLFFASPRDYVSITFGEAKVGPKGRYYVSGRQSTRSRWGATGSRTPASLLPQSAGCLSPSSTAWAGGFYWRNARRRWYGATISRLLRRSCRARTRGRPGR
jgi:hypothetical protein